MTDASIEKHFETSERWPALRVREQSYPDVPNCFVVVEERGDDGWYRIGSVELTHAGVDARGLCSNPVIDEWHYTRYHANGDRVRVGRRLLAGETADSFQFTFEEDREEVLGFGDREEHGWQRQDSWRFDCPGGEQR